MSSNSSSSRSVQRRSTVGIPTRCWCGANLTTYAAETKENLYRRFYRCEIAVQRKSEHHLFKWVDEAFVDEINNLDAKRCQLQAEIESYKRSTTLRFQAQDKHIEDALLEMRKLIDEQSKLMAATISTTTIDKSNHCTAGTKPHYPVLNIGAAAIALGTMAWLYVKLTT
ncbi:uncharacterized protein At4g04775 [Brassica rapa]|uniref:uncharacterized protein At4g04775-like n=1 Tax=Brassica napus TaxID=3708 RepID=UPI0004F19964|nr:uncharacterized protein At4g04775-like [Brassica napus]XP_033141061.1 uncharacterized protein At4g04775 [Brassica rapa]